eukprot:Cvel_9809.t1-p1 / transcript=Cvel_9809.t1 / gene=Cvel_9809 / organism=Chromera_velia_CCMP2878 / gene_product=hypothetical protein / transcript_product=hypothetical protein / location=Cvel_scaffold575:77164-78262(+) / protein_length=112 / sequence_SO=supercontig / SO=protein_coding / is_pseudo=false
MSKAQGRSVESRAPYVAFMSTHNAMADMEAEVMEVDIAQADIENVDLRRYPFRVAPWETIDTLKQRLLKKLACPMSTKDLRILYRGVELPNRRQVNDIDFHADARAAGDSSS